MHDNVALTVKALGKSFKVQHLRCCLQGCLCAPGGCLQGLLLERPHNLYSTVLPSRPCRAVLDSLVLSTI
jgi:hypothetical protein